MLTAKAAGFDKFVKGLCAPLYAARRGRPSLPPERYFRMLLVGYFEGIDSERGNTLTNPNFLEFSIRRNVALSAIWHSHEGKRVCQTRCH